METLGSVFAHFRTLKEADTDSIKEASSRRWRVYSSHEKSDPVRDVIERYGLVTEACTSGRRVRTEREHSEYRRIDNAVWRMFARLQRRKRRRAPQAVPSEPIEADPMASSSSLTDTHEPMDFMPTAVSDASPSHLLGLTSPGLIEASLSDALDPDTWEWLTSTWEPSDTMDTTSDQGIAALLTGALEPTTPSPAPLTAYPAHAAPPQSRIVTSSLSQPPPPHSFGATAAAASVQRVPNPYYSFSVSHSSRVKQEEGVAPYFPNDSIPEHSDSLSSRRPRRRATRSLYDESATTTTTTTTTAAASSSSSSNLHRHSVTSTRDSPYVNLDHLSPSSSSLSPPAHLHLSSFPSSSFAASAAAAATAGGAATSAQSATTTEEQKRLAHIQAEQKRRKGLKGGFEALQGLLPSDAKLTKQAIVKKSMDYIAHLQKQTADLDTELTQLRAKVAQAQLKRVQTQPTEPAPDLSSPSAAHLMKAQTFEHFFDLLYESFSASVRLSSAAALRSSISMWLTATFTQDRLQQIASEAVQRSANAHVRAMQQQREAVQRALGTVLLGATRAPHTHMRESTATSTASAAATAAAAAAAAATPFPSAHANPGMDNLLATLIAFANNPGAVANAAAAASASTASSSAAPVPPDHATLMALLNHAQRHSNNNH